MKLNPYILFSGNAEETVNFYKEVFGGEVTRLSRFSDSPQPVDEDWKQKIMHARIEFAGNILMISDGFKGYDAPKQSNVQLSIELDSIESINTIFEKLSAGGEVKMPLQDMFWGARFGMLKDKFGIDWMLNHELKK
jgi:PhnB protein